jgi:hypothetical protein
MDGRLVAQVLWLVAPVTLTCVAHMFVVKKELFRRLDAPLDGGRSWMGKPIFGRNKTWRGVLVVVLGAAAAGGVQGALFGAWAGGQGLACVDYGCAARWVEARGPLGLACGYALVNATLGAAYVLGELPNSFLKRRLSIDPGARPRGSSRVLFFLLDQSDSVVAGLAVCALAFSFPWRDYVPAAVVLALLHAAITASLHLARVKRAV